MNKNSPNTEEILDAIKNMMSETSVHHDEGLPKDVIELTNPIDEESKREDEKIGILELSNPINDKKIKDIDEEYYKNYLIAKKAGVNFLAYRCKLNSKEIRIEKKLKIINE